jgi:2'-5' RNA ligase
MRAREAGCSWEYEDYTPHITVADAPANASDLRMIEPYRGPIELGPEIFQEIDEDWQAALQQDGIA